MAKPKSPGADKFRVGQTCIMVFEDDPTWKAQSGKYCVVLSARRFGEYGCTDPSTGLQVFIKGWRYAIRHDRGECNVYEEMLRPIYDGEPLSTWEKFAKKTGIDITTPRTVARKRKSVA